MLCILLVGVGFFLYFVGRCWSGYLLVGWWWPTNSNNNQPTKISTIIDIFSLLIIV